MVAHAWKRGAIRNALQESFRGPVKVFPLRRARGVNSRKL
jgi:hypothetical protein